MYLPVQMHILMQLEVGFLVAEVGVIMSLDLQPS